MTGLVFGGLSEDRLTGWDWDRVLPFVIAGQADVVDSADAVAYHQGRRTAGQDLTAWAERVSSLIVRGITHRQGLGCLK
jgi:hypothetical protein